MAPLLGGLGRIGRNVASGIAAQAVGIAISLVATPVVVRGLGAADYGLWNVVLSIGAAGNFINMIFSTSAVHYVGRAVGTADDAACREAERALLLWAAVYGAAIAAVLALLAQPLAGRVLNVEAGRAGAVLRMLLAQAVCVFFQILAAVGAGVVCGHQRIDLSNGVRVASLAAQSLGAAAWVLAGRGVETIVWWVAALQVLECAAYHALARRCQPAARSVSVDYRAWHGRLLDYGGTLFYGYLASFLFLPAARCLLGIVRPMAEVAYFSVPATLAGNVRLPTTHIASALLPALSERHGRGDAAGLKRLCLQGLRWSWLALTPPTALAMAAGGDFISAWIGPDFGARAAPLVPLMTLGAGVQFIGGIPAAAAQGMGRPRFWAAASLAAGLLNVLLLCVFVPKWGALGAVAAVALAGATGTVALLWWAGRELGMTAKDLRAAFDARVLAVSAAAAWLVVAWQPALPPLAAVLLRAAAGACVVLALAPWWLGPEERAWVRGLAAGRPKGYTA